jgi:hypothetical protein
MAILETFNKNLLMVNGIRTLGEMEKFLSESKANFCPWADPLSESHYWLNA